jgi:agmatine deiminase
VTPRDRGWRLAPPWSVPGRFWLSWPAGVGSADSDDDLHEELLDLASLLSEFGPVTMLANPEDVADASLRTPAGVNALSVAHNSPSLRSAAPIFLTGDDGSLAAGIDCGAPEARAVLDYLDVPRVDAPVGLCAGALESDGEGTVLAAADLPGRMGLDNAAVERMMAEWLGVERVVWLSSPGGDIGLVARFLAPGLLAAVGESTFLSGLAACRDAKGRPIEVVGMPSPGRRRRDGGALSYADCVVAGSLVVAPAYEDGRDLDAFDRLVAALPDRKVIGHLSAHLASSGGGLGAMVAVQPRAAKAAKPS